MDNNPPLTRLLPFAGVGMGLGLGVGCGVGAGAGVGSRGTPPPPRPPFPRPSITPTYSLPSLRAARPAPYGVHTPRAYPAPPVHPDPHPDPAVAPARGYLNLARRMLREGDAHAPPLRVASRALAVRFRWHGPVERAAFLAGSFNAWGVPVDMPLVDGVPQCVLRLAPGVYWYRFVVDGVWRTDDGKPREVHERGVVNRLVVHAVD